MRTHSVLLAAIASAPLALAHTTFTNILVNGESQGDGVGIRMNNSPEKATFPISSLDSDDMACNVGGTKGVSRVLSVPSGATVSFEFRDRPDQPGARAIDPGHKGPCAVYLKKVTSAVEDKATGDGWFKIFAHGYESNGERWCTDLINDNNGLLSVKLPQGLQGGYYLARPEILALHAAADNDPQFYTGCAQIFLEGNGDLGPEETVSIPGYVKYGQDPTKFNIYYPPFTSYPLPGPGIAKLSSRGSKAASDAQKQTEGLKPKGCILENGNFCATEVSDFSDEKGCWAAGEECWAQSKKCWDSAGPTGGKGCKTWDNKCSDLNSQCKAGDFSGLKNKGKDLTATPEKEDVGKLIETEGGAAGAGDSTTPKTSAAASAAPAAPKPTDAESEKPAPKEEEPEQEEPEQEEPEQEEEEQEPDYNDYNTDANASPAAPANDKAPLPTTTIQIPVSEEAPAPTDAPKAPCPKGFKCIYEVVTVTKIEYVTSYPDHRRRSLNYRRHHGRAF